MSSKRKDYISWHSYFIGLAAISSLRSKDPNTQIGACIVQDDSPVAIGYNGFPRGCSDNEFPWAREGKHDYETKYPFVEHAERNAIYNAAKKGISLKGATIYLYSEKGYYPCSECTRAIIQSGIKKIVMSHAINENTDKYNWTATKKMLKSAEIKVIILKHGKYASSVTESLVKDMRLIGEKFIEISEILKNKE